MAENVYSFGKLPKRKPYRLMGGYYCREPREALPRELRELEGRAWLSPLAPSAPAQTPVRVLLDDGRIFATFTRSAPWQLGCGRWVVLLYGRTGGFALERVTPL